MRTVLKIYQNNLVSDILSAGCFDQLKDSIITTLSKVREQGLSQNHMNLLFDETLQELKLLNAGRFPYEQHANIVSAKNILKQIRLQESH